MPPKQLRSESSESTPDGHDVIDEISNCTINLTQSEYLYYVVWRPPKSRQDANRTDASPTATWEPQNNLDGIFGELKDSMNKYRKFTDMKIRQAKLRFKRKRTASTTNPGHYTPQSDYMARTMNRTINPEGGITWSFANESTDVTDDESWQMPSAAPDEATKEVHSTSRSNRSSSRRESKLVNEIKEFPPSGSSSNETSKPRKRSEPESKKKIISIEDDDEDEPQKQPQLTHWMKNKRSTSTGTIRNGKRRRLTEDDFNSTSKAPFAESSDAVVALNNAKSTKASKETSGVKKVMSPINAPPRLSGLRNRNIEETVVQLEELLQVPNDLDEMNWDILRRGIKEEKYYVHKMRVPEEPVEVEKYGVKFKDVDSGEVIFTPTVEQVEQNLTGKCVMCEFYKRHLVPRRKSESQVDGTASTENEK